MSDIPPYTPVLIAAAAVQQREEAAGQGMEPYQLMVRALQQAVAEVGAEQLLRRADRVEVPRGTWGYSDPARLVADAIGAANAKTVLAEIGILQQAIMNRACTDIANGDASIIIIAGAEAKYRALRGEIEGVDIAETQQVDVVPDETLSPAAELWSEAESAAGLAMPVGFYAILDSALRYELGQSVGEHRDEMARMYAEFSEIAAANADAWVREPVDAAFIREGSEKNRMVAFPYTKLHNSQWNVDQGAGLIYCSAAVAQALAIDRRHWIFPLAGTESNAMSVMSARKELGRNYGFKYAGERVLELAEKSADDIDLMELYSCFPQAVRVQLRELGLPRNIPLSVTGAMSFAAGPLNNFIFQVTAKLVQLLRQSPDQTGLITSVSGMNTKQACALYSGQPNASGWQFADVTQEVAAATQTCELVADYEGPATIAGYTVLYQGGQAWRAVAVCDLPSGKRTVAYCEQDTVMEALQQGEFCGRSVALAEGQFV